MFSFLRNKGKSSDNLDKTNLLKNKKISNSASEIGNGGSLRDLHLESKHHVGYKLQNHDIRTQPSDKLSPTLSLNRKERRLSTYSLSSQFRNSTTSLQTIKEKVTSFWPFKNQKKKSETESNDQSDEEFDDDEEIPDTDGESVIDPESITFSTHFDESEHSEDINESIERDILEDKLKNLRFADEDEDKQIPESTNSSGYDSSSQPCASNHDSFHVPNRPKNNRKSDPRSETLLLLDNYSDDETDNKEYHNKLICKQRSNSASGLVNGEAKHLNIRRQYQSCTNINVHGNVYHINSSENVSISEAGSRSQGYTDSEPTRFGSAPTLWTTFGCSEPLKKIREKTKRQLHAHGKKKLTTHTQAVKECIKTLEDNNGKRIILILGHEKDGKSCTAKNILKKLPTTRSLESVWETLIIATPTEWSDDDVHGESRKVVVLIDDMLGIKCLNLQKYEQWAPHFDDMCSAASTGNVAIFLPMNKRIYAQYCFTNTKHEIFTECKTIDLTSKEFRYTFDEKYDMLEHMLQMFPGAKDVYFRSDIKHENIDTFQEGDTLNIANETLKGSVEASTQFGYPQQMKEYCSEKKTLVMRTDFFAYPLDLHFVTIQNIQESNDERDKESMLALATVFVNHGKIESENLATYVAYITKSVDQNGRNKKQNSKMKQTRRNLIEKLADRLDCKENLVISLKRGIENISGWLVEDDNGVIVFSSHLMYNTVGLVCSKLSEDDVIKRADIDFLDRFVRPKASPEEIENLSNKRGIVIASIRSTQPESLKALQLRFANEVIKNKRIDAVFRHPIMRRYWFAKDLLAYLTIEAKTAMFLQSVEENNTVLYYGMNHAFEKRKENEPLNFTELLVESKFWQKHFGKDSHLKKRQELQALKQACQLGNVSTFECLYKHLKPKLDPDCLQMAVTACCPDLVDKILTYRPFFDQEKLRDMFINLCEVHCSEDTKVGTKLAKQILDRIDVVDKRKKCLHAFIQKANNLQHTDLVTFLNDIGCSKDIIKSRMSGSRQSILSTNSHTCFKY